MGAAVTVEGLRKAYGSLLAVDDASFEVADGEIFGVLGLNGSGKTTSVECVQGLRRADRVLRPCWQRPIDQDRGWRGVRDCRAVGSAAVARTGRSQPALILCSPDRHVPRRRWVGLLGLLRVQHRWATLPGSRADRSERPREPSMISPAPQWSAASTMAVATCPASTARSSSRAVTRSTAGECHTTLDRQALRSPPGGRFRWPTAE
jgi:ABC-type dipeptide/oligopeptide/nickel transport system ATPase component